MCAFTAHGKAIQPMRALQVLQLAEATSGVNNACVCPVLGCAYAWVCVCLGVRMPGCAYAWVYVCLGVRGREGAPRWCTNGAGGKGHVVHQRQHRLLQWHRHGRARKVGLRPTSPHTPHTD
jgi:hypothetical protein